MRKLMKLIISLGLICVVISLLPLLKDKKQLTDQLIRLHVVGATNSEEDQSIKLQIRDTVLQEVSAWTSDSESKGEAYRCISDQLNTLEDIVNEKLNEMGLQERARVTLMKESFSTRYYDTFTLPAGVYDSLRVVIGEGKGANWWCVVFPNMCVPAALEDVSDVTAGAGFSEDLTKTVTNESGYEIRFFLLDILGRIENFIFQN
jgi:stage II sporulation protein R